MPRSYRHVKEYEKEILALREKGFSRKWTIVKKVDRGMRKISKAQPRQAGRTKVQPD